MQDLKTRTSLRCAELKEKILDHKRGKKYRSGVIKNTEHSYRVNMQLLRALHGKWDPAVNQPPPKGGGL